MAVENLNGGVLTHEQVLHLIHAGEIRFDPPVDSLQLQQHSVDLRLGYTFNVPRRWQMTEKGREAIVLDYQDNRPRYDVISLEVGQFFELLPEESIIANILGEISIPDYLMAVMFPRSSVNRRLLEVGQTGIIDAGYHGSLLIPITNRTHHVQRLYPGERFCQLVFLPLGRRIDIVHSRWAGTDVITGFKQERSEEEEDLIREGRIRELKEKFKIQPPD